MSIDYGTTTENYIAGLEAELAGLDRKTPGADARVKLIQTELDTANSALAGESRELAATVAAERASVE